MAQNTSPIDQAKWQAIYSRLERASLADARAEAEAVKMAIERISLQVTDESPECEQHLAAGKLFEISNELRAAESAYRKAIFGEPTLIEASARLVAVLGKQGRIDEALEVGHDLLLRTPDAVIKSLVYEGPLSVVSLVADLYRISGKNAIAAGLYREAVTLEGGSPHAVNHAISAMLREGRNDEAVALAGHYPTTWKSEFHTSALNLAQKSDPRLPLIREVAMRAAVAGMESGAT